MYTIFNYIKDMWVYIICMTFPKVCHGWGTKKIFCEKQVEMENTHTHTHTHTYAHTHTHTPCMHARTHTHSTIINKDNNTYPYSLCVSQPAQHSQAQRCSVEIHWCRLPPPGCWPQQTEWMGTPPPRFSGCCSVGSQPCRSTLHAHQRIALCWLSTVR